MKFDVSHTITESMIDSRLATREFDIRNVINSESICQIQFA